MNAKQEMVTIDEIVSIEKKRVIDAFTTENGLKFITDNVDIAVDNFTHDLSTKAGRAKTTALGTKVRKVRKHIEDARKGLTSGYREKVKEIDAFGKVARDQLDAAVIRSREPLTELEEQEAKITRKMESDISVIQDLGIVTHDDGTTLELEMLKESLDVIFNIDVMEEAFPDRDMELSAFKAKKHSTRMLTEAISREDERIHMEEELAKLQEADKERQRLEREAEIIENAKKDALAAQLAAEEEARQAEANRVAAEEKAAEDALIAAAQAKKDAEDTKRREVEAAKAAKQREIEAAESARIAEVERQQELKDEQERQHRLREENIQHVATIQRAAREKLADTFHLADEFAGDIVRAIHDGNIPNVVINY